MLQEESVKNKPNLVLLGDPDVATAGLQLVGFDLAQQLKVHGEEHLQPALLYVVVPAVDDKSRLFVSIFPLFLSRQKAFAEQGIYHTILNTKEMRAFANNLLTSPILNVFIT
jgi:hypothetical protein